jgi:hypothetical protein
VLVSLPVLLETEWVLRSRYEVPPETILGLFRAALEARELAFEDEAAVENYPITRPVHSRPHQVPDRTFPVDDRERIWLNEQPS